MTDSGRAEDLAHQVRRPRKAPKSWYHQNMPEGEQGDNLWEYARMRRDHHTRGPFALSCNVPCYWDIARKAIESGSIIFSKGTQHRALWHAVFWRWATALLPQSFPVCTLLLRLGLLEGLSRISDVSRQQMRISLINGCVGVSYPSNSDFKCCRPTTRHYGRSAFVKDHQIDLKDVQRYEARKLGAFEVNRFFSHDFCE